LFITVTPEIGTPGISDCQLQFAISDCQLPISDYRLAISDCRFANCQIARLRAAFDIFRQSAIGNLQSEISSLVP